MIRGSYGVYHEGNVSGNWYFPPPGASAFRGYQSGSLEGPYELSYEETYDSSWVNPDLKQPNTIQWALGWEKQFGDSTAIGLQVVYKDGSPDQTRGLALLLPLPL